MESIRGSGRTSTLMRGRPLGTGSCSGAQRRSGPFMPMAGPMVIAGGNAAKFVVYPISAAPSKPETRLTNWAIMARLGDSAAPPRRKDWNRPGRLEDALVFVRGRFRLNFVDPVSLIEATG